MSFSFKTSLHFSSFKHGNIKFITLFFIIVLKYTFVNRQLLWLGNLYINMFISSYKSDLKRELNNSLSWSKNFHVEIISVIKFLDKKDFFFFCSIKLLILNTFMPLLKNNFDSLSLFLFWFKLKILLFFKWYLLYDIIGSSQTYLRKAWFLNFIAVVITLPFSNFPSTWTNSMANSSNPFSKHNIKISLKFCGLFLYSLIKS